MEVGLEALDGLRLEPHATFSAQLLLDNFVNGHIRRPLSAGGASADHGARVQTENETSRRYLERHTELVDPDRFPRLARGSGQVFGDQDPFSDSEQRRGLRVILDGLAANAQLG